MLAIIWKMYLILKKRNSERKNKIEALLDLKDNTINQLYNMWTNKEALNYVLNTLKQYNIPVIELDRYNESHRYYHNLDHILNMVIDAKEDNLLSNDMGLAIIFHDIIYNPRREDNEERSAELFYSYVKNDSIKQAILETKTHKPTSILSIKLCELDLKVIRKDYKTFIDFEHKIFKEYQWVDYNTYKKKRIEVLTSLNVNPEWVSYVEHRTPKIGIYAGSFNPFHKGHYNILKKAEEVFDKVIVARGINPEKNNKLVDLPLEIQNRQVELYNGLLTDFIDSLNYDVTLIRGLRNATDLQYELTQYRFLQELKPDIKIVSFFCDREFEHISSRAIRNLELYGKQDKYLL